MSHSSLTTSEVIDRFTAAMRAVDLGFEGRIIADGQLHRFRVTGDKAGKENGWYVLHPDGLPAGAFGCWKRGISETWCAKEQSSLSDAERRELSARMDNLRQQRESERQRVHAACKAKAERLWSEARQPAPDHPYLVAKGIKPYGVRQQGEALVVPLRDSEGALVSLQFIQGDGAKKFLTGTPKTGSYHRFGSGAARVLICEGFATGASLHEATGCAVAVAFDCGNLLSVAQAIRAKLPNAELVVCADDDHATEGNPGLTKARAAALAVGGLLAVPVFAEGEEGTDFNDLHQCKGLEAVAAALAAPQAPQPEPKAEQEGLRLLRASDIQAEPISWLWDGWLARGKLAILAGNPGSGKTTLALGLAAVITTAGRWPDKTPCLERGSVFVWSGEDDPADTLVPRLQAAGADLSRVHFLGDVVKQGERRSFDPGKDVPHLAAKLEEVGDVRLIIIDPIVSAVTGDGHKANDVRRSLQPIVDYAMKHRCAVIGITHFSKGTGGRDPLERVTGSQAYGALARVVMVAAKEEGESGNRVLARAKSNIGPDEGGVSYAVETCTLPGGITTSRVTWTGTMVGSARDILGTVESEGSRSATDEATDFLRDLLAHGPIPVKEAQKEAEEAGITPKALRTARERLGVLSERSGFKGPVSWSLPRANPEPSAPYLPTKPIVAQPQNAGMYGETGQVWTDPAANDPEPLAPALAANGWEEGSL